MSVHHMMPKEQTVGNVALDSQRNGDQAVLNSNAAETIGVAPTSQSECTSTDTFPWYYPRTGCCCCFRRRRDGSTKNTPVVYHGNPEVLGWAYDSIGRSVTLIGSGAFLATSLILIAKQKAGCDMSTDETEKCNNKVYGILKPSSLLTTYTIIVGVLSACMMPVAGAIIDYTHRRLQVGQLSTVLFCALLFPQIFLSERTFLAVVILQIGVSFTGWIQTVATYAYLPELTKHEQRLNEYTQSFTVLSFTSMVIYLLFVIGLSTFLWPTPDDGTIDLNRELKVTKLGLSTAFVITCILLYMAWFRLLQRRPATQILPPNQSLWTAGFIRVYHTTRHIYQNYPALKWFYTSVAFTDGGFSALATVALTYMTDNLQFSSTENGIAILVMLLGSIPGAYMARWCNRTLNPITSCITATSLLLVNTIVFASVVYKSNQQIRVYFLSLIWGMGGGWKWTTDRLIVSLIIPATGQDAELMGTYLFAGQIITWVPPAVYTILNEALDVSARVGLGSIAVWFILGVICLCCMGNYQTAVIAAGRGHVLVNHPSNCQDVDCQHDVNVISLQQLTEDAATKNTDTQCKPPIEAEA